MWRVERGRDATSTVLAQKAPNDFTRKTNPGGVRCTHLCTADGGGMAYVLLSTSTHPKCLLYTSSRSSALLHEVGYTLRC